MSLFNETTESTETNEVVETQETPAVETPSQEVGTVATETTTGETTESTEATETVDPREAVSAVGEQYGYATEALGGFETPEAAEAAIKFRAEQLARVGLSGETAQPFVDSTPPPQQAGTPDTTSVAETIDLKALGLEDDDPAGQAIRALEAKVNATAGQSQQIVQAIQAQQAQARQQQQSQLQQEADVVVSGFQSPEFGTTGNRTAAQDWNVQRLYDLSDAIAIGAHRQGQVIPPLQQRLNQAKLLFGGNPATPKTTEQKKVDALPINRQSTREEVPGMKMTTKWSENPELLAAIRG